MTNTIEGFNPNAKYERMEKGQTRPEGRFRKLGKRVMGFIRRELAIPDANVRRASDSLRAHAAQLQKESPHLDAKNPNLGSKKPFDIMQGDLRAEYHPPVNINTTADKADLGQGGYVPSAEARFRDAQEQPLTVEGQVMAVEDTPLPPKELESTSEDYFAPRMSGTLPPEVELHNASIGSENWNIARETPVPQLQHEVSIGSASWHEEQKQSKRPDELPVLVSEQPEAKPVVAEDAELQARRARRAQAMNLPRSYEPGTYRPEVIGAEEPKDNQNQKAA